jgi:hypothetical protein
VKAFVGNLTANAKWPLSMEGIRDQEDRRSSRGGGGTGLGDSCPGGRARRRVARRKLERERRHGCQRLAASAKRGQHPRRGQRINALRMQPAEAELTGVVKRLLPRQSGRAQTLLRLARCKSRGCTGNQRVRVLVVEKFEWQSSEGRIEGACPAWRCKATRREQQQVPSRKEAEPSEETPDDGGR